MADYVQKLRDDLVEQFKGKPVIDAVWQFWWWQILRLLKWSQMCRWMAFWVVDI